MLVGELVPRAMRIGLLDGLARLLVLENEGAEYIDVLARELEQDGSAGTCLSDELGPTDLASDDH